MPDAICPTFASGTFSVISGNDANDILVDKALAGQANGYASQLPCETAGSFNNGWANGCLTQSVGPTFSTSLVDFGNTGRQS